MRNITESETKELLSLTPKDLTFRKLVGMFGVMKDNDAKALKNKKPRFDPQDVMTLTPDRYFVKKTTNTTVGAFIFNKYIIEGSHLQDVTGYVDWEITSKGLGKLETIISTALLDDKITRAEFDAYINRRDTLGQQLHAIICSSFTMNILKTPKEVEKRKEELFKQHAKEIENGDVKVAVNIEHELLDVAKEKLKDDPAMDLYMSGARGSFNNNYKNINIMKGPVFNSITGKYDIVKTGFLDGMEKKDIGTSGNSIIAGSYPCAVGTRDSGYMSKQLSSAMQCETLDEPGSDCGTKRTISLLITNENKMDFLYRYIVKGGTLIELNHDNIDSYVGQTVDMRSPLACIGKKLCNHCMGNLFYKLNIKNFGLTSNAISSVLLQMKLSAKHDGTKKIQYINPDDLII